MVEVGSTGEHRELRVLYVIPGTGQGSSMIFARRQAWAVAQLGVRTAEFYLTSRTHVVRVAGEWIRLRAVMRRFAPHVVHALFGTMTGFLACVATLRPFVVTYFGGDLNPNATPFWPRSFAGRLLSQLAALRASAIVCVSQELRRRLWWRRGRVVVLPCGADTSRFYPRPRDLARATLGLRPDERIVLFNAGFEPWRKRIDLARAAVAQAERWLGPIRLEIMDGSCDPDRVPVLMNAADCLLVTSDSEGSPTVVQEAIACNLPVVSVDVGDVAERLTRVRPSRIVARDPEVLGRAVADVLREGCRSNGSDMIDEVALSGVAGRLVTLYSDLVGEAKARRAGRPPAVTDVVRAP